MELCAKHWASLRAAIETRGLMGLVAKDAPTAMQHAVDEVEGTADPKDYDPLASACWMIYGVALERGGLYLMSGDLCPICEAMKHTAHLPKNGEIIGVGEPVGEAFVESYWIDGPADTVLAECRKRGIAPPAS
jgi:hypothetical protein